MTTLAFYLILSLALGILSSSITSFIAACRSKKEAQRQSDEYYRGLDQK